MSGNKKIFSSIETFIEIFLGFLPVVSTVRIGILSRYDKTLGKLLKNISSEREAEFHILAVIDLAKNLNSNVLKYIKFHGFLRIRMEKSYESSLDPIYQELSQRVACGSNENLVEEKQLVEKFIGFYIEEGVKRFPKSENLRILLANYQFKNLKNFWLAIETMTATVDLSPSFSTGFCLYRISQKIKKYLVEKDRSEIKQSSFDVRKMLNFRENYLKFLRHISKGVKINSKFWKELADENPNPEEVKRLGLKSVKNQEEITKQYKTMNSLSQHNKKFHLVYAEFLEQVVQKKERGTEILEKVAENQIYRNYKTEDEKILDNIVKIRESCIFTLGANLHNFGIILKVCNQVKSMIGYESQIIEGQNVEIIMPNYYHQKHDGYMMQYFKADNTSNITVVNKNRVVFPETKDGYLKQSKLRVRIFPNIERGIRILGILTGLSEKDKEFYNGRGESGEVNYLVYDRTDGAILGISESCFKNFGISATLFSKTAWKMPKIQMMMPEALDQEKIRVMKSERIEAIFDTTSLMEQFYFDNRNFDYDHNLENEERENKVPSQSSVGIFIDEAEEQEGDQANLKRAKVIAWITQSSSLKNENLHCLRFQEVNSFSMAKSDNTNFKIQKKLKDEDKKITISIKTVKKIIYFFRI